MSRYPLDGTGMVQSLAPAQFDGLLERSEVLLSEDQVLAAIDVVATRAGAELADSHPVLLCVMNGGLPFTGELLHRWQFPLELDYVHATRYAGAVGGALEFRAFPQRSMKGRTVVLVDDILDAGHTLAAISERLENSGAARVCSIVLTDKQLPKPAFVADWVGCPCPDRYVFGWGMDYNGFGRNLRAIHAVSAHDLCLNQAASDSR